MPHQLLSEWARFRPKIGPNILDEDRVLLERENEKRYTVTCRSWSHLVKHRDFGKRDPRLELSLIPQPFFGNIDPAPVVILTLNPGLSPIDYYSERFVEGYRRALVKNLRLGFHGVRFPNLFLNPAFS